MTVEIFPYLPSHIPAVQAFNARLRSAGIGYAFPASNVPAWLPPGPLASLYQELFVAVEDDAVRGGYILKHQDFVVGGSVRSIGALQLPLSEGTVDRRYAAVGVQLLRDALRRQPLLYALGMGGYGEAAARLLQSARFEVVSVPFHFRVEHATRFLQEVRILRSSRLRRLACDLGAATGLGALGIGLLQRRVRSDADRRPIEARTFSTFDESVNAIWAASAGGCALAAVRDRPVLARLYEAPGNRFIKVAIRENRELCGWTVLLSTPGHNHKHFGDLKLGSIVDLMARPGYERALIGAAVKRLQQEGVDLIVSNQTLKSVREGLRDAGFLSGPSNFLFAASPKLLEIVGPLKDRLPLVHFTRGDGDGPINL